MRSERGQASVEWVGLLLLVALVLGALMTRARDGDARSLGDELTHRIACAAEDGCGGDNPERGSAGGAGHASPPRARRDAATVAPVVAPVPVRGGARALFRAGTRKVVALNGLICYIRKSTARDDTNRVGDDIGDAINCLNPVGGWTGNVGGTDD